MKSNKEMNFTDSLRITANLKEAVRLYVSEGGNKITLTDYHIPYPSFLNESQRESLAEELELLEKSGNEILDAASHTMALSDDGNINTALKSLEFLNLKVENYQLQ